MIYEILGGMIDGFLGQYDTRDTFFLTPRTFSICIAVASKARC